jgi:hypothetical protein
MLCNHKQQGFEQGGKTKILTPRTPTLFADFKISIGQVSQNSYSFMYRAKL